MSNARSTDAPSVVRTSLTASGARHVCPPWIAYLLASPVRRLFENPDDILGAAARPGDLALDIGCAMGFFSLPLARLVGPTGRLVCVDVQSTMLDGLQRRLRRHGLADRVEARLCREDVLPIEDLKGQVDVALIIHMLHEVPDPEALLAQVSVAMKPGGKVVFAEPKGHVSRAKFDHELQLAEQQGLVPSDEIPMRRTFHRLLRKA